MRRPGTFEEAYCHKIYHNLKTKLGWSIHEIKVQIYSLKKSNRILKNSEIQSVGREMFFFVYFLKIKIRKRTSFLK